MSKKCPNFPNFPKTSPKKHNPQSFGTKKFSPLFISPSHSFLLFNSLSYYYHIPYTHSVVSINCKLSQSNIELPLVCFVSPPPFFYYYPSLCLTLSLPPPCCGCCGVDDDDDDDDVCIIVMLCVCWVFGNGIEYARKTIPALKYRSRLRRRLCYLIMTVVAYITHVGLDDTILCVCVWVYIKF